MYSCKTNEKIDTVIMDLIIFKTSFLKGPTDPTKLKPILSRSADKSLGFRGFGGSVLLKHMAADGAEVQHLENLCSTMARCLAV